MYVQKSFSSTASLSSGSASLSNDFANSWISSQDADFEFSYPLVFTKWLNLDFHSRFNALKIFLFITSTRTARFFRLFFIWGKPLSWELFDWDSCCSRKLSLTSLMSPSSSSLWLFPYPVLSLFSISDSSLKRSEFLFSGFFSTLRFASPSSSPLKISKFWGCKLWLERAGFWGLLQMLGSHLFQGQRVCKEDDFSDLPVRSVQEEFRVWPALALCQPARGANRRVHLADLQVWSWVQRARAVVERVLSPEHINAVLRVRAEHWIYTQMTPPFLFSD